MIGSTSDPQCDYLSNLYGPSIAKTICQAPPWSTNATKQVIQLQRIEQRRDHAQRSNKSLQLESWRQLWLNTFEHTPLIQLALPTHVDNLEATYSILWAIGYTTHDSRQPYHDGDLGTLLYLGYLATGANSLPVRLDRLPNPDRPPITITFRHRSWPVHWVPLLSLLTPGTIFQLRFDPEAYETTLYDGIKSRPFSLAALARSVSVRERMGPYKRNLIRWGRITDLATISTFA